jgi:hypothetical protein
VRADFSAVQERLNGMKRAITEGEKALARIGSSGARPSGGAEKARGEDAILVERETELVSRVALEGQRRADLEARAAQGRGERADVLAKLAKPTRA